MTTRPARDEAAEYYFRYIDQVPAGDVVVSMARQADDARAWLLAVDAVERRQTPAGSQWTRHDIVGHLSDAERLFQARAFWFARGFQAPLPSFDQDAAAAAAGAPARDWSALVEEFSCVRAATIALFSGLPPGAWDRRGVASGHVVSVRALAFIAVGHVAHHLRLLREPHRQA